MKVKYLMCPAFVTSTNSVFSFYDSDIVSGSV